MVVYRKATVKNKVALREDIRKKYQGSGYCVFWAKQMDHQTNLNDIEVCKANAGITFWSFPACKISVNALIVKRL